jgi:type IV pilus assembly protein PilB
MVSNEELIEAINKEAESAELKKIAQRGGMKTLHQDSILKVKEGLTPICSLSACARCGPNLASAT